MAKPLVQATGRRKSSVARVRLYEGTGRMVLNGKSLEDYFPEMAFRLRVLAPVRTAEVEGNYDIHAKIEGGGFTGQSDALRLGIARALVEIDPELRTTLKKEGYLRRDARRVERKKYGLRKARRAPQFTKR
jgi:small subunit ribosomal protein S9